MIEINNQTEEKINLLKYKKNIKKILDFLDLNKKYLSIAIVSKEEIKKINKNYRSKNKETDVLSFPNIFIDKKWDGLSFEENDLGEIILCYDVIKKQSKENYKTVEKEFLFMCVHSVLHLLGYEDEKSEQEYQDMERMQNFINRKLYK